jgi:hypothetical protein
MAWESSKIFTKAVYARTIIYSHLFFFLKKQPPFTLDSTSRPINSNQVEIIPLDNTTRIIYLLRIRSNDIYYNNLNFALFLLLLLTYVYVYEIVFCIFGTGLLFNQSTSSQLYVTACYVFPENLLRWRDSNPGVLFLRRMWWASFMYLWDNN